MACAPRAARRPSRMAAAAAALDAEAAFAALLGEG
eukprot:gene34996-17700_t